MARYGRGRGSKTGRGTFAGTTLATIPSGVTLDKGGIAYDGTSVVTPTELGYVDGMAGYPLAYTTAAGYEMTAGFTLWAGTTLSITHGLTTLTSFVATYEDATPVSSGYVVVKDFGVSSKVSAMVYYATTPVMATSVAGGTLYWIAFGT